MRLPVIAPSVPRSGRVHHGFSGAGALPSVDCKHKNTILKHCKDGCILHANTWKLTCYNK
jgi:hypothetical protein